AARKPCIPSSSTRSNRPPGEAMTTKAVTKMTLKTTIAAFVLLLAGGAARGVAGQARPAAAAPAQNSAPQNFDAVQMQVLHVQGNVYMIAGAGGHTTVQAGHFRRPR